jgi:WD40 repeat protein
MYNRQDGDPLDQAREIARTTMVMPHCFDGILIGFLFSFGAIWPAGRAVAQPGPAKTPPLAAKTDLYGDPLPPGAVMRLGTIRHRQDSPIYRVAWTPDGRHFVTDGEDSILRVWDAAEGRVIRRIDPGVGAMEDFAIASRGGLVLASGQSEDFAIASRGDLVLALGQSIEPERGWVRNVTLTHLGTGRIEDHGSWPDGVYGLDSIALNPDRRLVAVATFRGSTVRVCDARNGAEVCRFETGREHRTRLLFSRDGRRLAVLTDRLGIGGDRGEAVRIYDLDRKEERQFARWANMLFSDIAFAPDGSTIATADHSGLGFWAVSSGERVTLEQAFVQRLAYSADGRSLLSINGRGLVEVFDLASRKAVSSSFSGISDAEDVALSPNGKSLLIVSEGQAIHAWDLKAHRDRFASADAQSGPAKLLVLTPDGKTVVTGGADKTVRLWDLGTGKPSRALQLSGPVEGLAVSPDGRRLAAATYMFHQVFIWDLPPRGSPIVLSFTTDLEISMPLALRFLDASTILLVDKSGALHYLDVEARRATTGAFLRLSPSARGRPDLGDTQLAGTAFLPGGERLAVMGFFTGLHLLEITSGRELYHDQVEGAGGLVASPDGRILAVAHKGSSGVGRARRLSNVGGRSTGFELVPVEGPIRFIEAGTGQELRRVELPGSQVWAMAFSPDGKILAATSGWETGEIHLYDVASGREARTIVSPPLRSPALAFTPDGSRLVSGMADGSILVWDVRPAR